MLLRENRLFILIEHVFRYPCSVLLQLLSRERGLVKEAHVLHRRSFSRRIRRGAPRLGRAASGIPASGPSTEIVRFRERILLLLNIFADRLVSPRPIIIKSTVPSRAHRTAVFRVGIELRLTIAQELTGPRLVRSGRRVARRLVAGAHLVRVQLPGPAIVTGKQVIARPRAALPVAELRAARLVNGVDIATACQLSPIKRVVVVDVGLHTLLRRVQRVDERLGEVLVQDGARFHCIFSDRGACAPSLSPFGSAARPSHVPAIVSPVLACARAGS